ncbi:MAG TPA: response regulator [Nitrospirales bacterium]|nr:response regulator [Nitrospirales bacterium]
MVRILLIDNDADCLTALAQRLSFAFRHLSLDVDKAESACSALLLARERQYDLMIVDEAMRGTVRGTLLDQLRVLHPDVPLILTSGCEIEDYEILAEHLNILAHIPKPIDFPALCGWIETSLPSSRPHSRG